MDTHTDTYTYGVGVNHVCKKSFGWGKGFNMTEKGLREGKREVKYDQKCIHYVGFVLLFLPLPHDSSVWGSLFIGIAVSVCVCVCILGDKGKSEIHQNFQIL